jgi:hypothetical protein
VSGEVRDLAWSTQERLYRRLRAMQHRRMSAKKALVAVTRELACAIWALDEKEILMSNA